MQALQDEKDWWIPAGAAWVLRKAADDPRVIPALIDTLSTNDGLVRGAAVGSLGEIGPAAKDAVLALTPLLDDRKFYIRVKTASALWSIDQETTSTIPVLIACLKHTDSSIRVSALEVLGSMGSRAESAVPIITEMLNDPDESVRKSAARQLKKIIPEAGSEMVRPESAKDMVR